MFACAQDGCYSRMTLNNSFCWKSFYCRLLFNANATWFLDMQCTIAHALEKTKYPNSDLYWKKFADHYHFSCQFTTDLIAMNHADFIITSTFQEIAGK